MGRRKLSEETGRIQVILLLDDPAQRHAFEQLDAMMGQGTMQEYMRKLLVSQFPIVSHKDVKNEIVSDKIMDVEKAAQPKAAAPTFQRPAFTPVPKPGGKS